MIINESIFESGAILMYLGEKSGKFYDEQDRLKINQWLMAQMGTIGPMIGQHHQFHHYNPGKSEFGEERYFKIAKRIYQEFFIDWKFNILILSRRIIHSSYKF
jgi:GST-like protein